MLGLRFLSSVAVLMAYRPIGVLSRVAVKDDTSYGLESYSFSFTFLTENRERLVCKTHWPTGQNHSLAECLKGMQAKADTFKHLDFVVETLTGTVGTLIQPCVFKIMTPVTDAAGCLLYLWNTAGSIEIQPVRKDKVQ